MVAQTIELPNIRKLFIPDPGYTIIEGDLARAEAQVVAWESGDEELKHIFHSGIDIHTENAVYIFGPMPEDKHTKWWRRDRMKRCVYAIQNVCKAPRCGELLSNAALGVKFFAYWTGRFPAIPGWHAKLDGDLKLRHCLENIWGYKRHWFDRLEGNYLGEAVPWITQSTIAKTINHGLIELDRIEIEVLLQVHDSVLMQVRTSELDKAIPAIRQAMSVPIPYPDPLIIPVTMKASEKSWGDADDIEFDGPTEWHFKTS